MQEDIEESGVDQVLDGLWLGIQELADLIAERHTMVWQDIKSQTIEHDRALRRSFEQCRERDWELRTRR
jgi:hypothetical protein